MAKSANPRRESGDPLIRILEDMSKERKLPMDILIPILEEAISKAYKYSQPNDNVVAFYDSEDDAFKILKILEVVEEVEDEDLDITAEDAKKMLESNPDVSDLNGEPIVDGMIPKAGDVLRINVSLASLGRIAIQNLKQTMNSKILEAENNLILAEYRDKIDSLVSGTVQRIHKNIVYVNIGRAEAIMTRQDQNPMEYYYPHRTFHFAIKEIKITNKGPQVYVTRTDAKLIRLLFRREVPEIASGEVVIEAVSREAGSRTKVSVRAENPEIDPVGACVGPRGMRLENIIKELNGEKIDVIEWSDNPAVLISNALSPARVMRVEVYEDEKSALVVVPNDQLSLAIGKEGQNARLAVKLTDWRKIDIKDETQYNEYLKEFEDEYEDEYEDEDYENPQADGQTDEEHGERERGE